MLLYFERGLVRVFLTHHIAMQLPAGLAQAYYDLACDFRQNQHGTLFSFQATRWPLIAHAIIDPFPRRFRIWLQR